MKLFEIFAKDIVIKDFFNTLEEEVSNDINLNSLLNQADEVIFKKFGIDPKQRNYFIAGSARLYLYPKLRELFNLSSTIGDLDIVIPEQKYWDYAGLSKEYQSGVPYKPTNIIEAFNVWDPSKAGGDYANVKVRPTSSILIDSTYINGHYFMSLGDIVDYKIALNRDKETDIINLIKQYQSQNINSRTSVLKSIADIIGFNKTKEFIGSMK